MRESIFDRRRQRDANRALGKLLAVKSLPVISWTIPVSGALVGDVDSLTSTPDEQRAAFDAWIRHLNAEAVPDRVAGDGNSYLYAKFRMAEGFGVGGAIRATIYPHMSDEAGEES
ncbi:hypothetical protein [Streptomyces sp. NPDC088794]|uniref:hypothetical protein n=1 Tax=Streptomyces sp. NPDC088794 TaxID=3365902 RepID=UPI0038108EE1